MAATQSTGLEEWRRYWTLPLAAAIGYSVGVIHLYSLGAFIGPLQQEFGWTRAEASIGLTFTGVVSAFAAIPIGMTVDRLGPRRVGLVGAVLMGAAFALLGTATGSVWNWIALWCALAFATFWIQTTVWTSAVASRFEASRGIAFGVTLSGASLAAAVFPIIAASAIAAYGWRNAFFAMGGLWGAFAFLALLFFFRGAQDRGGAHAASTASTLAGLTLSEGMRKPAFYKLFAAAFLFTFTGLGVVVHFLPILTDAGADPIEAAGIASLVGIFSMIGRLGAGFLLDRFPAKVVGACAFVLPMIGCALLLLDGANPLSQSAASALIGFTVGAEVDVIAYLASRHFGLKNFGALFGAIVAALAFGAAFGPLASGATFDRFGAYAPFLALAILLLGASSLILLSLSHPPFAASGQTRATSAQEDKP